MKGTKCAQFEAATACRFRLLQRHNGALQSHTLMLSLNLERKQIHFFAKGGLYIKHIETTRLVLRDWTNQDLNDLFTILSNPNIALLADSSPITSLRECKAVLDYLIQAKNNYAVELKSTGRVIGTIGLNEDAKGNADTRNLGFSLAEEFWNQGIMTEALATVIANAKDIADKLSALHKQNPKTEHILKKFGFQQVDIIRNIQRRAGETPHEEPYYILIL